MVLGFIVMVMLIYTIVRFLLIKQRRLLLETKGITTQNKKKDDLGFVVDTFHDMVKQLKEKEQELQRLRSIAEERVESIESYNENILRSVASGVITFDRNGRIITFNPSAEDILSKKAMDVIGKTCEEVFGEDSPITRIQRESLKKEEGIPRLEVNLKTVQGNNIWLGLNTSLLRDRNDELIGLILVFSDLTEIKHLQSQMELKERFTLLGEMSAGIAHELRNPMGAIAGFAKLLSRKLDKGDERKSIADAIEKEIEGMNRVISELLTFTKPTDLNLSETEIKSLIEDTLTSMPSNSVKINLNLDPIPTIEADEVLLKHALINLFQNAIEAMPEGGELKIVTSYKSQVISPEVEIEISDTGIGIPEDRLKRIFHPFFTTKEKGTGLGLSLVQKIILYHGGRIEVGSREGKGTTFRIYLPIKYNRGKM
jgi:PAS domain S-box-containing protein